MDGVPRLDAAKLFRARPKRCHDPAQLPRIGNVLSVVYGNEPATGEFERIAHGFRLGAGLGVRHDDDAHEARQVKLREPGPCLLVDLLEDKKHVELGCRIVDFVKRGDEIGQYIGFAEQRNQDGVDR